jgi:AcrR family transcriptional regulator
MTAVPSRLGRPAGADGEQTRQRIITAAMRSVAEVGYSQATIREIARAADMTSGSLYHYFPNKSELLRATVSDIDEIAFPRLRAAATQADDAVDRLVAVLDELDRLMREYPHLAAFDRAMRTESATHRRGGRPRYPGLKALRENINDIIEDARARGALPPDTNPGAAVNAIYALSRGLTEQAANLTPEAYAATVAAAKELIRGTLFARRARRPKSTAQRRSAQDL